MQSMNIRVGLEKDGSSLGGGYGAAAGDPGMFGKFFDFFLGNLGFGRKHCNTILLH